LNAFIHLPPTTTTTTNKQTNKQTDEPTYPSANSRSFKAATAVFWCVSLNISVAAVSGANTVVVVGVGVSADVAFFLIKLSQS
jgi:hypothetical protein